MSLWRYIIFLPLPPRPAEFSHLLPDDMVPKKNMTFGEVVPVSALTGLGIERLKHSIRETLDEDAAEDTNAFHQERLQTLRRTMSSTPVWGYGPQH